MNANKKFCYEPNLINYSPCFHTRRNIFFCPFRWVFEHRVCQHMIWRFYAAASSSCKAVHFDFGIVIRVQGHFFSRCVSAHQFFRRTGILNPLKIGGKSWNNNNRHRTSNSIHQINKTSKRRLFVAIRDLPKSFE